MQREIASAVGSEVVKATPPVVVIGAHMLGLSFQDWVYVLTAGYIILQSVLVVIKIREHLRSKKPDDTDSAGA